MFELTSDYLAAEEVLVPHLAQLPSIKKVYYNRELSELAETSQVSPCLHVIYYGDQLPETANAGALMQIKQTWLVVLACRVGRKEQAGELMIDVIKSLAGKAINGMGPWLRVNSPVKPKFTKGYAYYPLAFTCQMRLRGN